MATDYEGEGIEFKETLPLVPIRDLVVYPFMILPLFVGRESSIQAVEHSLEKSDRLILLASQKDATVEHPGPSKIYEVGTVAMIMRIRRLPDGRIKILVQGLSKAKIIDFKKTKPYFLVKLNKIEDLSYHHKDVSAQNSMRNIREQLEKIIEFGRVLSPDLLTIVDDTQAPGRLADLIASNLELRVEEAQEILEILDPVKRLHKVSEILTKELEILAGQKKIRNGPHDGLGQSQKERFLREQIRAIKSELGENDSRAYDDVDDEFQEFREKIKTAQMPENVEKEAIKQLNRLEKMHPDSSESTIIRSYLEWMVDLPWSVASEEKINLKDALDILNEDHFDLKKVKERILEHLAVYQLKGKSMTGPILCFNGPPGVGKTSLGKSIARSCGREFVHISLGGVKDEAEIRGHRKTYLGSMPGRIIQALKQAKTNNPVILLDEIDKMGGDYKGDPSSALLEVLDIKQNKYFRDHYLNVPFDLSNVMFIATSNVLQDIPRPLQDRLEVLNLSGYTEEEKIIISDKFIIPKQIKENGISEDYIEFNKEGIECVIRNFTREAGLRNLERRISSLCRKVAHKIARGEKNKVYMLPKTVVELLGPPVYTKEDQKTIDEIGVTTGLAWSAEGGDILYIETTCMKGKGITLTGQLGDTMKESAQTAIGHIRSKAQIYGIEENIFENNEIHIHFPAGAIPKDGPSAGIAIAVSIVSLFTGFPVSSKVAMTGEITLTGKVLPIGGLKEKALAAMRLNINTIIIPWKNQKDLVDIPEEYRKKINFIPVKTIDEVLHVAIVGWEKKNKKEMNKKIGHFTRKKNIAA